MCGWNKKGSFYTHFGISLSNSLPISLLSLLFLSLSNPFLVIIFCAWYYAIVVSALFAGVSIVFWWFVILSDSSHQVWKILYLLSMFINLFTVPTCYDFACWGLNKSLRYGYKLDLINQTEESKYTQISLLFFSVDWPSTLVAHVRVFPIWDVRTLRFKVTEWLTQSYLFDSI